MKGKERQTEKERKWRDEGKGFRSLVPRPFVLMNGLIRGYEFRENRREKEERQRKRRRKRGLRSRKKWMRIGDGR